MALSRHSWLMMYACLTLCMASIGVRAQATAVSPVQDGYFHFVQIQDTVTGEPYYVAGVNGHTWQVNARGIVMRLESERRQGLFAIARRDFVVYEPIRIRPVGRVTFPVRRYDDGYESDEIIPCYTDLLVEGALSGGRVLRIRVNLNGLLYHVSGTADASDGFTDHGGHILDQAGIPRSFAFPLSTADIPIPFTKNAKWLSVDRLTEELRKPVMVSDPRIILARYVEDYPKIAIDREDNVLLSSAAPFFDPLPFTPELIDDSISTRSLRTTKIHLDRSVAWSVYTGPVHRAMITVFDRENNAISVGSSRGVAPRGADTYSPMPHGHDDVWISKWSPEGRLLWSTFVGGDSAEVANCATVDSAGTIYVGCQTKSIDFPVSPDAFIATKPNYQTRFDAAVFALSNDGKTLRWSTYLSSGDNKPLDAPFDWYGELGAKVGGIAYDGVDGVITGVWQWAPNAMPVTSNAWKTSQRGGSEGMVTRFHVDGRVHWSTLISTIANDYVNCVQSVSPNRTVVLTDQRLGRDAFELERVPSIGVPGQTLTEEGKNGFVYEFDSTGIPLVLWAPFLSTEQSVLGSRHYAPFISATAMLWRPTGDPTLDAIQIGPNCASGYPLPSASVLEMSRIDAPRAVFTSSFLGIYNSPYAQFRASSKIIVALYERFSSRGACLTDTLWGSGFGDNSSEQAYLVIIRHPSDPSTVVDATTVQDVELYPNPTSGDITVAAPDEIISIHLYTIDGRELSAVVRERTTNRVVLDTRGLAAAGYLVRVSTVQSTRHHLVIVE